MGVERRIATLGATALCTAALALLLAGCGGGSTDSGSSSTSSAAKGSSTATPPHAIGSASPNRVASQKPSSPRPAPSPASAPQDRPPFTPVDAGIASTLHAYFEDSASGDFEGVCATLISKFRTEATELAAAPGRFHNLSCGEILAASAGQGRGAQKARESLGKSQIIAVQYAGRRAIVHVHRPGFPPCPIPMRREEGRWLVASLECRFG